MFVKLFGPANESASARFAELVFVNMSLKYLAMVSGLAKSRSAISRLASPLETRRSRSASRVREPAAQSGEGIHPDRAMHGRLPVRLIRMRQDGLQLSRCFGPSGSSEFAWHVKFAFPGRAFESDLRPACDRYQVWLNQSARYETPWQSGVNESRTTLSALSDAGIHILTRINPCVRRADAGYCARSTSEPAAA